MIAAFARWADGCRVDQAAGLAVALTHGGLAIWLLLIAVLDAVGGPLFADYDVRPDLPFGLIVGGVHLVFVALGERLMRQRHASLLRRVLLPVGLLVSLILTADAFGVAVGLIPPATEFYVSRPLGRVLCYCGVTVTVGVSTLALLVAFLAAPGAAGLERSQAAPPIA